MRSFHSKFNKNSLFFLSIYSSLDEVKKMKKFFDLVHFVYDFLLEFEHFCSNWNYFHFGGRGRLLEKHITESFTKFLTSPTNVYFDLEILLDVLFSLWLNNIQVKKISLNLAIILCDISTLGWKSYRTSFYKKKDFTRSLTSLLGTYFT